MRGVLSCICRLHSGWGLLLDAGEGAWGSLVRMYGHKAACDQVRNAEENCFWLFLSCIMLGMAGTGPILPLPLTSSSVYQCLVGSAEVMAVSLGLPQSELWSQPKPTARSRPPHVLLSVEQQIAVCDVDH